MPSDKGHRLTEEELSALSRRISDMYKQAADELTDTINGYFAQFNKRDERMRGLIGQTVDGREWTEQDYKRWRLNQMGRGERYRALQQKLASRMTDANEVAMAYINDVLPGIYTLNRNYSAYKIEGAAGSADFTLWDEATVRRLATEQPDLMPYYPPERAIKRKIDLDWGKKQITKSVTSGLLQGKSTGKIASDLKSRIEGMNRDSAVRAARTAITGAENAGRMDTYAAAQKMGIKLKKEWLATLDNRTRHAHAMLDGQKADVDKPFRVDGREIRFPGDPQAHPSLVYNCRCTLVSQVDGADTSGGQRRARDPATGKSVAVSDMSFSEWERWKASQNSATINKTKVTYKTFSTGEESNDFFYYDGESKSLLDKRKSKHSQWEKGLSEQETDAITDYTGGGYYDINAYLRKTGDWEKINPKYANTQIHELDSAIRKYELKDNIRVQRGVGDDVLDELIAQYGDDSAQFVGKIYHDNGYMSTTALRGNPVATAKPVIFEIDVPAGTGRGAYVNRLAGQFQDTEYEFLLRRGADYTIEEVVEAEDSGKLIIKMVMNDE